MIGRVLIALAALAVALSGARQSLALALAGHQPSQALIINARDPSALANAALTSILTDPLHAPSSQIQSDVLHVVRADPTNISAISSLAIIRALQGSQNAQVDLMRYAERISRRSLLVELFWIEYWSEHGDVTRTLAHYDTALRTNPNAPSELFPVLINASADPAITDPLTRILARRPLWADQFVQQLAQSSTDVEAIARMLDRLSLRGAPVSDRTLATAIDRLVTAGRYDLAWSLFTRYRPEAKNTSIRNPDFSANPSQPTQFDWQLSQEGVSSTIENRSLRIDAPLGNGGIAARQLVRLPMGVHHFRLIMDRSEGEGGTPAKTPVLVLRCAGSGVELPGSVSGALQEVSIHVPEACPFQTLEISLQALDERANGAVIHLLELRD